MKQVELNRDDKHLDKIIRKKFTASFMNDAKWVKLISKLVENYTEVKECNVKLIWEENGVVRNLRIDENITYDFDYYHNAMEAMVEGNPKGWYAYREIEWVEFPRLTSKGEQNLESLKTIINRLGEFYLELTKEYLRLYAYR